MRKLITAIAIGVIFALAISNIYIVPVIIGTIMLRRLLVRKVLRRQERTE